MNITWRGSPNKNDASYRKTIDRVVLHWFGIGNLLSADNRFQSPTGYASAHYGISDDTVYQWVKESEVAWHAGDFPMNQRSIGIEHDTTTTKNATEKTYETAGKLLAEICTRHNIPLDREHIIKHSEIKATQCPGTLDVDRIIALAKGGNMSLTQDIETEVEEKFRLKEIDRYSKYWTYEELIADWVKLYKENKFNSEEMEKYKKEALTLRSEIETIAEDVAAINKELDDMDKVVADNKYQITELRKEVIKITEEKETFVKVAEEQKAKILKLMEEKKSLEDKLLSQSPIKEYSIKEMLEEIFNRIFKGNI